MTTHEKKVLVIGHKNPDTDSICSAIAYADVKNRTAEGSFVPMRAGQINEETEFVLNYFRMVSRVLGVRLFVFVGVKQYFSREELSFLYPWTEEVADGKMIHIKCSLQCIAKLRKIVGTIPIKTIDISE